jgi:hypothetical protein
MTSYLSPFLLQIYEPSLELLFLILKFFLLIVEQFLLFVKVLLFLLEVVNFLAQFNFMLTVLVIKLSDPLFLVLDYFILGFQSHFNFFNVLKLI